MDVSEFKVAVRIRCEMRKVPGEMEICPVCEEPVFGEMIVVALHQKLEPGPWKEDWTTVPVCCTSCAGDEFALGFNDDP